MNNLSKIIKFIKANNKNTIFSTLGIKIKSYNPDDVILTIATDKRHLQHTGLIHGGVYLILSESAASIAAALKVNPFKYSILGMEINANHVNSSKNGIIKAKAKLIHHGNFSMIYSINVTNNKNKLLSISRCTIALKKINI